MSHAVSSMTLSAPAMGPLVGPLYGSFSRGCFLRNEDKNANKVENCPPTSTNRSESAPQPIHKEKRVRLCARVS